MQGSIFRGNEDVAGPLHPSLVEEYPRGLSEQWLSGLLPLPAGVYGVRVLPGPHWLSSGFGGDNEGSFGVVRPPTPIELAQWAAAVGGGDGWNNPCPHCAEDIRLYHQLGGWHPSRSAVVDWQIPGGSFAAFYKAGDDGDYDLYFHPEDLVLPGAGYDPVTLYTSCADFNFAVFTVSGSLERARTISECEADRHVDPALRELGEGASVQSVADGILEYLEEEFSSSRQLGRRVLSGFGRFELFHLP